MVGELGVGIEMLGCGDVSGQVVARRHLRWRKRARGRVGVVRWVDAWSCAGRSRRSCENVRFWTVNIRRSRTQDLRDHFSDRRFCLHLDGQRA